MAAPNAAYAVSWSCPRTRKGSGGAAWPPSWRSVSHRAGRLAACRGDMPPIKEMIGGRTAARSAIRGAHVGVRGSAGGQAGSVALPRGRSTPDLDGPRRTCCFRLLLDDRGVSRARAAAPVVRGARSRRAAAPVARLPRGQRRSSRPGAASCGSGAGGHPGRGRRPRPPPRAPLAKEAAPPSRHAKGRPSRAALSVPMRGRSTGAGRASGSRGRPSARAWRCGRRAAPFPRPCLRG